MQNLVTKNQALQLLTNQYAVLTQQAVAAERAAKSLRVDAAAAPDAQEKQNVTAFADALDGALHRQRTIARDLGGMIAIFNVRPQLSQMDREEMVINEQLTITIISEAATRRPKIACRRCFLPSRAMPPKISRIAKPASCATNEPPRNSSSRRSAGVKRRSPAQSCGASVASRYRTNLTEAGSKEP